MIKEDKQLLLKDLSARLTYGIKILHTGWDCDSDTDFDTVETLIGIDDKFIYTVWDKTGDREKHCLSVSNWKPYLRPMSSMTKEEKKDYESSCILIPVNYDYYTTDSIDSLDWLNKKMFDFRGLIPSGLALEAPEGMYNIKDK